MATTVLQDTFQQQVLESDQPVLVDFWAPWCGPCRAVAPVIDELAEAYEGKAKVVKIDVDQSPGLAQEYGVNSIPAFFVFKNGKVQGQAAGALSKDALSSLIDEHL
ncbi:MAG: thioredoxin [Planctomycetaceae bacterium]